MSVFGSLADALGGIYAADSTPVKTDAAALQDAIHSGALQQAAAYGPQGAALNAAAAGYGTKNVSYDPSAIDADSAALAPVAAHYLDQFRNGGLAAHAAVQAQQQARGLDAHGEVAGIRADTVASGGTQDQVGNVAQNEIEQAGNAVNSLDSQKAAIALKKAVMAAQVSHANLVNHLNAQQIQFGLRNSQQQLFNTAQENLNDLSNSATSTDIAFQQQQNQIGQAALQGLLSAAGAGIGTAVDAGNAANALGTGVTSSATPVASAAVVPSNTGLGAGYIQPAATMGRAAVSTPAYQPIFATAPTLPTTADYFNRGGT